MAEADPTAGIATYPREWETHAVLADGETVEIRPIRPDDRAAIAQFHSRQSPESIYFRYFRPRPVLSDRELDFFTQVDYRSRMAFVVFDSGELVAVARYEHGSLPESVAEVAFFVDDANHGRGLGTLLLEYLAAAARANGFATFTATVLPENYRMLSVFRAAGFTTKTRFVDGVIEVSIDLTPTSAGRALINDRLRRAVSRSIAPLLEPTSVAVIGAGRRPGSLGHQLLANLLGLGFGPAFEGITLAVNPNTAEVLGSATWPTVADATDALPDVESPPVADEGRPNPSDGRPDRGEPDRSRPVIDLALIAVPADRVAAVVDECGEAGVHGVLVVSSDFADGGGRGVEREQELVATVRKHGMRMIGPNAFGIANTAPSVNLNLMAVPVALQPGGVALASDSGVLAAAVVDQLRLAGVGLSEVVGIGNQADVTIGDLIGAWALHDATRVIVVYTERLTTQRIGARALADAARLTSMTKPVVAVRPPDTPSAQLLAESGVILVDAVSELADQAAMMSSQPVPLGSRVAIISNSASLARLTEAACRRFDLTPVVPTHAMESVPAESILIDDLDQVSEIFGLTVAISRSGTVADYERMIVATGVDEEVDAVILALVPTDDIPLVELERLADRVNRSVDKPFMVVGLYDRSGVEIERLPFFTFPEEAARTLARSAAYGRWRLSVAEAVAADRSGDALSPLDSFLGHAEFRRLGLTSEELPDLLADLGLSVAPFAPGRDLDELRRSAEVIGYPVVLKIDGLSDAVGVTGGTAIDLHDAEQLEVAYNRLADIWGSDIDRIVIQKMVPHSVMARMVLSRDPALGPSLSIGFGGSGYDTVEPLDRTFLPTTDQRLDDLVAAYRRRVDPEELTDEARDELRDLAAAVADVGTSHTGVDWLVFDPILIGSEGVVPVDVEIRLARVSSDPLDEVRRLE